MALVRLVLAQQVHHTEFEGGTLFDVHVAHDLKHLFEGGDHDERVLLLTHQTEEFSEV